MPETTPNQLREDAVSGVQTPEQVQQAIESLVQPTEFRDRRQEIGLGLARHDKALRALLREALPKLNGGWHEPPETGAMACLGCRIQAALAAPTEPQEQGR